MRFSNPAMVIVIIAVRPMNDFRFVKISITMSRVQSQLTSPLPNNIAWLFFGL
jgi:hypothetical protein